MKKMHSGLTAMTFAMACAFPALAQQQPDPSLPGAATANAMASGPAVTGTPAASTTSAEPGVTSSDIAGTPVQSSTPAAPSNAAISSDATMATAVPSAPSISADAAGTSTPPTSTLGAGPMEVERDDGGFDMGWLGLFGLLGLLGMRRRHHDGDRNLRTAGTMR